MKVSKIFAGILIILLGLALFLSNFDLLTLNWHFIFRLWPILLVLAGISVLVSDSKLKAALYAVTIILVLVWIFAAASGGWHKFHGFQWNWSKQPYSQQFIEKFDRDIRQAVLDVNAGAGSITLNDTTSELLDANTESNLGNYSLDADKKDHTEKLDLTMEEREERNEHWFFGGEKNKVNIKLNPVPAWELNMDVGACSVDFDLSPYAVTSADFKAGASSMKIRLGDKSDTTHLTIDAGASSITISVPQNSGCQIRDKAMLSSKSFPDFAESNDGTYKTTNFESSKKKIFIDFAAGVSSIKINRY